MWALAYEFAFKHEVDLLSSNETGLDRPPDFRDIVLINDNYLVEPMVQSIQLPHSFLVLKQQASDRIDAGDNYRPIQLRGLRWPGLPFLHQLWSFILPRPPKRCGGSLSNGLRDYVRRRGL